MEVTSRSNLHLVHSFVFGSLFSLIQVHGFNYHAYYDDFKFMFLPQALRSKPVFPTVYSILTPRGLKSHTQRG